MTHSHGVGLYAFSVDGEVGVDVETTDRRVDAKGVARRFFTERESDWVLSHPEDQVKEAFVRIWTCKEACLKWTGAGLKGGLRTHEIEFEEGWAGPRASGEGDQPALAMLEPAEGWTGALAADDHRAVRCQVWEGGVP